MLKQVSLQQGVSVRSAEVYTVPSSDTGPDQSVADIRLTVDFSEHSQFAACIQNKTSLVCGKDACCSCHIGKFSTHLKDDELQLVAFWRLGEEGAISLISGSLEHGSGGIEIAQWEIVSGNAKPADEQLLARIRPTQLQLLVCQGACLADNKDWIAEALHTANRLRARHSAPPLEWCPKAAARARKAADDMVKADKRGGEAPGRASVTTHDTSYRQGFGQIIMSPDQWRPGEITSPKGAIIQWYQQQFNPGYDFFKAGKVTGTTDFTQLVWESTTHIGMDCDSSGKGYIVACLSPPGNINGEFRENVHPSQGAKAVSLFKARFKAFDNDGDNHLSIKELERMLRVLDPTFTRQEITFVMNKVDKDDNGKVDFEEFVDWCFKKTGAGRSQTTKF